MLWLDNDPLDRQAKKKKSIILTWENKKTELYAYTSLKDAEMYLVSQ